MPRRKSYDDLRHMTTLELSLDLMLMRELCRVFGKDDVTPRSWEELTRYRRSLSWELGRRGEPLPPD